MRRNGFTLIEMMIVVTIISLVSLIALPRFRAMQSAAELKGARSRVVSLYNQARLAAQQTNRPTALRLLSNKAYVVRKSLTKTTGCKCDTVGTVLNLAGEYHVTVAATADSVHVYASGIGAGLGGGSGAIVRLTSSTSGGTDSVVISSFGQVK